MSLSYPQNSRRRPGTGFSASGKRTFMGYWVPLAVTVSVATIGIAAWIWSERNDDDNDGGDDGGYRDDDNDGSGDDERTTPPGPIPDEHNSSYIAEPGAEFATHEAAEVRDISQHDDNGVFARMQGALRRTPSPQEILDGASRRVAAGITAAGAFMGLAPIREEGRGDFEDHTRWSEEVQSRAYENQRVADTPVMSGALQSRGGTPLPSALTKQKINKTVAIVVSSVSQEHDPVDLDSEHVSILSQLPEHVDLNTSRVFVLIYAPGLKHANGQGSSSSHPTPSVASSYSNIAREEADPNVEHASGGPASAESRQTGDLETTTPYFKTLQLQAQPLVEKDTMIMPFSTPTGYVHLVRHLSPDLVYVQESLTGNDGSNVHHLSGWVRQAIVVVGGEGGSGGLVDSEDESALADKGEKWWQKEGVTGIGKRIDVIDGLRIGDDWQRRVRGHD